ncbi:hypothetical protein CK203_117361 [Vitis vinifera]|uniref:Retrotransposon gag domain-containing protein n=1 Tax=Vitis vinifera TaxID=29760 RepID=A0A438DQI9_VITVI|nr:hypothetical protein CK203_117361 [Vitis vinifera]
MSLSGAAQRWFASVEPSRLRTWEDVAPEVRETSCGIPFQDLRSLVQAAFSVEEAIARGLWTDTTSSPDTSEAAHHSAYRPPTVRAPFSLPQYQYQPDYVQEPYIAQTSMQPRPSHPRAATHPPPRPYAQRPARQFTPLGMTLTRAFEKLRDAGVIVPLAPRPLPHPIPPHFRSHEHCLYHRFRGTILSVVQHSIMRYRT